MDSAPTWIQGLSTTRRRTPFLHLCLFCVAGLAVLTFLLYTLTTPSFDQVFPFHNDNPNEVPETRILAVGQPQSSSRLHWDYEAYNNEALGMRPEQGFVSSEIRSPLFQVNTWKPRAAEGAPYLFMTPAINGQPAGMQIFSRKDLSLVYADYGPYPATNNFRVQEFNGSEYLTVWAGKPASGHGQGYGIMFDKEYNQVYNLSINTLDTKADSHEFQLTHDGGAMMTAYETVRNYDMTAVGGPVDAVLQDSCFEEVDIATGATRFTWCARDWFNITETTVGYNDKEDYGHPTHGDGWDFFHINSLEKTMDGNYLVVGRRLNMVTLISGESGAPIWQVGGKHNQYTDLSKGRATNFAYQHHARFDDDNQSEIVMFDNSHLANTSPNPGCKDRCSRGLHIRLDHEAKTAELVQEFWHPLSVQARAEGSAERQANGNMLVGWGKVPGFTEYSADGEVLLDVQTGPWRGADTGEAHVYRVYSSDWTAYPPWNPEIAKQEDAVYVSWNGATELVYWAYVSQSSFSQDNADLDSSPGTPPKSWSRSTSSTAGGSRPSSQCRRQHRMSGWQVSTATAACWAAPTPSRL